jgi:dihydrodipicolinate reductase
MTRLRLLINGARGRMGQTVVSCAKTDPEIEIAGQIDIGDDLVLALADCQAVVDFSRADATAAVAQKCADSGKVLVIGTTGQDKSGRHAVEESARKIPIVFAPNFSVGVNALFWLTRKTTEILGPDFDVEIVEMHHRLKKDAPSGTAKRLAEIVCEARSLGYENDVRHGRLGMVGERTATEVGMHALRGGDVVGDHLVLYAGIGERIELAHKASSRETFAKGALRAVKWAQTQSPGLYDMQDVLGLR